MSDITTATVAMIEHTIQAERASFPLQVKPEVKAVAEGGFAIGLSELSIENVKEESGRLPNRFE